MKIVACHVFQTTPFTGASGRTIARLLLDMSENGQTTENGTRFRFMLTHEQIGEFIGASRETVTRLFTDFKKKQLLQIKGSTLVVRDRAGLEKILEN